MIALSAMFINGEYLMKRRKAIKTLKYCTLMVYIILPAVATICLIFFYGISLTNIAVKLSMPFLFFLEQHESRQMIMKQKVEIEEMKRDLMISQITPHFLFNSLSTIKYLCRKEPKEAENAVDEFSKFLRSNMDSMETNTTISFHRGLSHIGRAHV